MTRRLLSGRSYKNCHWLETFSLCNRCDMCTSEIRSVRQTGGHFASLGNDVNNAFLYEVHLGADCSLSDDVVARLEHLVLQLWHHLRHEVRIGVCKERNWCDQRSTVVVNNLLYTYITSIIMHFIANNFPFTQTNTPSQHYRRAVHRDKPVFKNLVCQ